METFAKMNFVTGTKAAGRLIPVNPKVQTYSEAGKLYELHMEASAPIEDKEKLAEILTKELPEKGLTVTYVNVGDDKVVTQAIGTGFEWAAVLAALPGMFFLVGVALAAISIFLIWNEIPGWTVGLGLVGVALLAFGWYASKHKWWMGK